MPLNYTGTPSNVGDAGAVTVSEPVDGDALAASSVQTPYQKIADYLQRTLQRQVLTHLASVAQTVTGLMAAGDSVGAIAEDTASHSLVAVGGTTGSDGKIIYSTTGGETWANGSGSMPSNTFTGVTFNGSVWVAMGYGGAIYSSSAPSGTWTSRTNPLGANIMLGPVWGQAAGVFVGCAYSANGITSSPDGTTWTSRSTGITGAAGTVFLTSPVWGGAQFVIGFGDTNLGNGGVLTSPDGITWTKHVIAAFGAGPTSLQYGQIGGAGKYVAVVTTVGSTRDVYVSDDALAWTKVISAVVMVGYTVLFARGGAVLMTAGTSDASPDYYSFDGTTWTAAVVFPRDGIEAQYAAKRVFRATATQTLVLGSRMP